MPFTFVDGEWKISYQGFCRFVAGSASVVGGGRRVCDTVPT